MYCQRCGAENPEGVSFCARCGNPMGLVAYQPPLQPGPAQSSSKTLLAIVAVVVVLIVVVAVIAVLLVTRSSGGLEITDSNHTSSLGIVIFTVEVKNNADSTQSGTIHCRVTFGNGDIFTGSQEITLASGQTETFVITVTTGFDHFLDLTGEYDVYL